MNDLMIKALIENDIETVRDNLDEAIRPQLEAVLSSGLGESVSLLIKAALQPPNRRSFLEHIVKDVFEKRREFFQEMQRALSKHLEGAFFVIYEHLASKVNDTERKELHFGCTKIAYSLANERVVRSLARNNNDFSKDEWISLLMGVSSHCSNCQERCRLFTQAMEKLMTFELSKSDWLRILYNIACYGTVSMVNLTAKSANDQQWRKGELYWTAMFYALLFGRKEFIKQLLTKEMSQAEIDFGRTDFKSPNLGLDFLTVASAMQSFDNNNRTLGSNIIEMLVARAGYTRQEVRDHCVTHRRYVILKEMFNNEVFPTGDESEALPPEHLKSWKIYNKNVEEQLDAISINERFLVKSEVERFMIYLPDYLENQHDLLRSLSPDLRLSDDDSRLNSSLQFLLYLNEELEGNCKLFGSVAKGNKIGAFNEFDVQVVQGEDLPRNEFMTQLKSIVDRYDGDQSEVTLTKSGACIVLKDVYGTTTIDVIPVVPVAGLVDCTNELRAQIDTILEEKPSGWIKFINWIVLDGHFIYENPSQCGERGEVEAVKMTKYLEFVGDQSAKIDRYFRKDTNCRLFKGLKRNLICSLKIIAKRLRVIGVKSFTIENAVNVHKYCESNFELDLYQILSLPSLKCHFQEKIDFLSWNHQIKNPKKNKTDDGIPLQH